MTSKLTYGIRIVEYFNGIFEDDLIKLICIMVRNVVETIVKNPFFPAFEWLFTAKKHSHDA